MSTKNLDSIFKPSSVAVIGASDKPGKLGNIMFKNLVDCGFEGDLYPVNPGYGSIYGYKCYRSVTDIDGQVDLAVIVTPISTIPGIIAECGKKGIRGTIVISAGGKETGQKGRDIEESIIGEASKHGIRVLGPNCLGVLVPGSGLNATFASRSAIPGDIAFISQSGALCTAILDMSARENIGFSHFISIGSMADVDFGDLIDYLGSDEQVKSIILYIESITDAKKFMSSSRSVSRIKPVIALKAGKSSSGAKAAASHTGAMAGEDDVYDAAFKRAGILRVDSITELFDCAEAVAKQPLPRGASLCIITNAGGPGVMAADKLEALGMDTPELKADTIKKLSSVLPGNWSRGNPVDIIGDATPSRYTEALEICLDAEEIDGIVVILTPQAMTKPTEVAKSIAELSTGYCKPVFAVWMGGQDVAEGNSLLNETGIPTYRSPEEAVNIFVRMYSYGYNLEILQETPVEIHTGSNIDKKRVGEVINSSLSVNETVCLSEHVSKEILEMYGVPVNRTLTAATPEEAANAAGTIGFPVVLKIDSPDITHKTDAGGVMLDLGTENQVRESFNRILDNARKHKPEAAINGVTVQKMIGGDGYEIIAGSKYDELFGPVILFGAGGTLTELIADRALGFPPLNSTLAKRMIESTRIHKLLEGYRGKQPVDIIEITKILISLSQLVTDFPEISEIDINPLYASSEVLVAVDARIIIRKTELVSPQHMAIAPYPSKYVTSWKMDDGTEVLLRPIKPEDEKMMTDLFKTFSERTIISRFFENLKTMPHAQMVRYTQIDYDREMAIVAEADTEGGKKLLGVGRLNYYPNLESLEFSVVVGDPWQGRRLGRKLIERCIEIASQRGVPTLWGEIGRDNRSMIKLCESMGFRIEHEREKDIVRAEMDL